jgi:hydrogenase/urease accessory protein HupE
MSPEHVVIRATVSTEEVLVAAAYGGDTGASFESKRRDHGEYLRHHLFVTADGRALNGRSIGTDDNSPRPTYTFEYSLSRGAPVRLQISEDVLREFDYAPGNPWEASYLVQVHDEHGPVAQALLTAREPLSFAYRSAQQPQISAWPLAGAFVRHGIIHILTGYDHLLFVAALLLATTTLWDLIKVITAFTLAHTLTLTLAALDLFRLPETIVEPMIAASIVFVAVQNVFWPSQSRGASRLFVAFAFGLFHGLGFAGGLLDAMANLPGMSAALAIAAFSIGVELGHQVVVLPMFAARRLLHGEGEQAARRDRFTQRYGSAAISCAGMAYLVIALR